MANMAWYQNTLFLNCKKRESGSVSWLDSNPRAQTLDPGKKVVKIKYKYKAILLYLLFIKFLLLKYFCLPFVKARRLEEEMVVKISNLTQEVESMFSKSQELSAIPVEL
jgi:hypothetical protein